MMDMAMTIELAPMRALRGMTLALGLSLAAFTPAQAQDRSPQASGDRAPSAEMQQQEGDSRDDRSSGRRPQRTRSQVQAYLEVVQVLSADLDSGGETLTYTSVAAGVDGQIQTRRVTAQMSLRYERNIEWSNGVGDRDVVSGLAAVNAQIIPGALQLDAGALATRTGGDGRVFGVTNRSQAVDVYSAYVGPTLSTHAGPLAVNASYRLGYVRVDDHRSGGQLNSDFNDSVAHSATASVGMAPGTLPFGWTVGAGYAREDSGGRYDQRFEGMYVRGDIVVPVGATLALTAGVGYEDIEADQRDLVRDINGFPVIGPNGPTPDPTAPRLLTYDQSGMMYDAGVIWRPSPRTELQARAGHRYGGTTVTGSLDHRFNEHQGIHAEVFDTVETFGNQLNGDLASLGASFDANRDPVTGGLSGCVFGAQGGSGGCFDRSLSAINGNSFRMRGGSLVFSGERGLWNYGLGAGYAHRRYARPTVSGFAGVAGSDQVYSVYGTVGRQLSRTSEVNFDAFASWYDSDVNVDIVSTVGATVSYNRSFLLDRLQLLAALGLYHSDDGVDSSTNASASGGLRYTF
jgi:hypothetical protein